MKHYNAFALAALLLLLGSCSDDTTGKMSTGDGQRLTFTVDIGASSEYTATTTRSASTLSRTTTVRSLEMESDGATPLYAQCHTSEGVQLHNHVAKASTRGTEKTAENFYTQFGLVGYSYGSSETWSTATKTLWINNDAVSVVDGTWTSSQYWLGPDYRAKFFAYAPNSISVNAQSGSTPTISYTVPSDISTQQDLLVAESDDDIPCDGKSDVALTFRHALTAVKFTAEHIDGYSSIIGITLSGVNDQGTYSFDTSNWSGQTGSATYSLSGNYPLTSAFTDISGDNLMLLMPQTLPSEAKLTVTMSDGSNTKAFTANLAGRTWIAGHTVTYKISLKKLDGTYKFTVEAPSSQTTDQNGASFTYNVTSYFENTGGNTTAIPWTADYSVDGESTRHSATGDIVSEFQAKSPAEVISNPSALASQTQTGTFKIAPVTIALSSTGNTHTEALRSAAPVIGSSSNPYDLSTIGGTTARNTANCYIVKAAGWYSLPLVYGNAIKNGGNNEAVYGSDKTTFVNSAGQTITAPYLKYNAGITPDNAVLVWQDAYHLIDPASVRISNDKERLIFHVPQEYICQGNCVLAVRNSSNVILWSWHIWVTDEDVTKTVSSKYGNDTYVFMPVALGHCDADTRYYPSHSINVKITQNESGETSNFTISQSTATTQNFGVSAPYYQWGRKDPQHPSDLTTKGWKPMYDNTSYPNISQSGTNGYSTTTPTLAWGIINPNVFYSNWSNINNNDLWHIGNSVTGEEYKNANKTVAKSIYDPCPVGFKMPHINAFVAFSTSATWNSTTLSRPFINGNNWYAYGIINTNGSLSNVGSYGNYWSAGPYSTTYGYYLAFNSGNVNPTLNSSRAYGFSVRPVSE